MRGWDGSKWRRVTGLGWLVRGLQRVEDRRGIEMMRERYRLEKKEVTVIMRILERKEKRCGTEMMRIWKRLKERSRD